ncbi:MAG: phosphatase PAP2 family protein [Dehalococcoidia bacterium]|nr:phosphatase PAP2 family protein [Dehalococcoidia bacterium]
MSSRAAVAAARQNRLQAFFEKNWRHIAELLFLVPAYTSYQFVRGAVHGKAGVAFDNASQLIRVEQRLHIFHEAFLQQLILPKAWMVDFFNYIYIWGHLPVIIAVAIWLYTRHRGNYAIFRNAFLISGLIALLGFAFVPLAPPRYMPEFGFTNTIINAQSYYAFQNPKIVNQYAAMPSLHFGWDLLAAIAIGTQTRLRGLKLVAVLMPLVMLSGIVMTANHYFLDAAAGGFVALLGLGIALGLRRLISRERFFSFLA